jgi:hypothetical protein
MSTRAETHPPLSFRGAAKAANPESIFPGPVFMDSGLPRYARPPE